MMMMMMMMMMITSVTVSLVNLRDLHSINPGEMQTKVARNGIAQKNRLLDYN